MRVSVICVMVKQVSTHFRQGYGGLFFTEMNSSRRMQDNEFLVKNKKPGGGLGVMG